MRAPGKIGCVALKFVASFFGGWEGAVLIVRHQSISELAYTTKRPYSDINGFLDVKSEELDVQSMLITNMPTACTSGANTPSNGNGGSTGEKLAALIAGIKDHAVATLRNCI